MKDEITVELWIATNRVGSKETKKIRVEREDWERLSGAERHEYMWEELLNQNACMYEWGFREIP